MAKIKITNGFPDLEKFYNGIVLSGILLSGEVKAGDFLIIDNKSKLAIKKVEFDSNTFSGTIHVRLFVEEENRVTWHNLYNNNYETSLFD